MIRECAKTTKEFVVYNIQNEDDLAEMNGTDFQDDLIDWKVEVGGYLDKFVAWSHNVVTFTRLPLQQKGFATNEHTFISQFSDFSF